MELGAIPNVGHGARTLSTPHDVISKIMLADDDAAMSATGIARRAAALDARQDNTSEPITAVQRMRSFSNSDNESLVRFEQVVKQLASGRFSPENMRTEAKLFSSAGDTPWGDIWDDFFALSFDSMMVSLFSKCSVIPKTSEKRGIAVLAWLKNEGGQALQSQGNLDSQRVLKLLTG